MFEIHFIVKYFTLWSLIKLRFRALGRRWVVVDTSPAFWDDYLEDVQLYRFMNTTQFKMVSHSFER